MGKTAIGTAASLMKHGRFNTFDPAEYNTRSTNIIRDLLPSKLLTEWEREFLTNLYCQIKPLTRKQHIAVSRIKKRIKQSIKASRSLIIK